jgi:mannosyltransferase
MRVAVALLVVTALSVRLRTGGLDAGFWIDEAIAVGIASHDPGEIPGLLRQDGSPPLYYLLLHGWIALAGTGEAATRSLSLLFAAVAVPVAWWAASAVGGRRAGAVAAAIVAVCPFFAYYAQEARMYTLVAVLSLVAAAAFVLAFLRGRRRHLVTLGAALVLLLYTHTWGVFLAAGLAVAWLGLWRGGRVAGRDGALLGAAVGALFLPWAPSLAFQALHTGAPWSVRPSPLYLLAALAAAAVAARRPRDDARGGDGALADDAARVLALVAAAAVALAWVASQVEPAWSPRYLAVLFGPALVALACLAARRTQWAVAAPLALVVAMLLAGPPVAKSNARAVAASVAPSVRTGDLVVCTQPEQVPVLHRYLPAGVEYLTPLGTPADPALTDWREALARVRAARARLTLLPLVRRLEPGRRLILVTPVARRARSPWSRAVLRRTREWRAALRADPRLTWIGRTSHPDPTRFRSAIRAELFEVAAS